MATDPMLDPDYKYSINKFTGNGSKTSWDLNFSGGYIRREHVKAYTQAADGQITELSFTWSGPNTIVITPPVANGVRLFVYRDTPKSGPLVDFTDGAIINEFDLDMMARQTVFATAEMVDRFADVAIGSQEATATANAALQRAAAAQVDVAAATTASVAALGTAQAAETKANTAVSTANTAKGTADAAAAAAGGAVGTANAADSKATSALSQAATAAGQSASALTTSQSANSKADTAVARALDAQAAAANANTVASAAAGVANTTADQFDDLRDTVEEIAGGDLSNFVRVTQENTFVEKQTFSAGAVIGGVQWGGSGANAKIINAWGDLTGKPTTFPPDAHNHPISGVTGLQGALDAKATNSALTTGLAGKLDKTGGTIDGALRIGGGADNININGAGLELAWSGGPYLDMKRDSALDFEVRIQQVGTGLDITAPSGMRVWSGSQPQGNSVLTGANQGDAVLKSQTNLGKTIAGPLRVVDGAVMDAVPLGYSVMTAPGSTTPTGSYGYFFKTGLRDNNAGWSGLWHSHGGQFNRMFIGYSDGIGTTPRWNEVATLTKGDQDQQDFQGVNRFMNGSRPGLEIWHPDGRGLRFGPAGGFSFAEGGVWGTPDPTMNLKNVTFRNRDESFRDLTAQRGDGSGAIFLGGGAYLYHNTAGVYEFGGTKDVQLAGTARLRYGGGRQPRITVQSNAPTAEMVVGDLWAW